MADVGLHRSAGDRQHTRLKCGAHHHQSNAREDTTLVLHRAFTNRGTCAREAVAQAARGRVRKGQIVRTWSGVARVRRGWDWNAKRNVVRREEERCEPRSSRARELRSTQLELRTKRNSCARVAAEGGPAPTHHHPDHRHGGDESTASHDPTVAATATTTTTTTIIGLLAIVVIINVPILLLLIHGPVFIVVVHRKLPRRRRL